MDNSKRGHIPMQERLDLNKTQGASRPEKVKRMKNVTCCFGCGNPVGTSTSCCENILKYLRILKICYWFMVDIRKAELRVGAVDWKSYKQSTTAMSATEVEYIAASCNTLKSVVCAARRLNLRPAYTLMGSIAQDL
ncbi:hypothetical protein Tco_0309778 [Tanacetum coccineum]